MIDKAVDKIRDEMVAKTSDNYVQAVGDMLLNYLADNPGAAEQIMSTGKTIAGSLSAMQAAARKKSSGNCAVLTDAEGFAIVLEYFGITEGAMPARRRETIVVSNPKAAGADFDVSLDDLLGR